MTRKLTPSRRPSADDRRFLDTLVMWRALYAQRGPRDSMPVVTVATVIAMTRVPSSSLPPARPA